MWNDQQQESTGKQIKKQLHLSEQKNESEYKKSYEHFWSISHGVYSAT